VTDLAVSAVGLTKRYGDVAALDGAHVRVDRGEIYGFLGLNGAGKTTTIRLLLGMMRPTSGHAEIFGARVGPGTRALWKREQLTEHRRLAQADEDLPGQFGGHQYESEGQEDDGHRVGPMTGSAGGERKQSVQESPQNRMVTGAARRASCPDLGSGRTGAVVHAQVGRRC
jgi:energy-coupling factor transporter ATP-binding protein EcfA2